MKACFQPSRKATVLLAIGAALACLAVPAKSVTLATVSSGDVALHLDASAGVTGSGPVTAWADQSGNGFNFGNTVGTPTLVTGAMNGKDVIRFSPVSGNDGFRGLTGSALNTYLGANALTIFMVTQGTLPDPMVDATGELNGLLASSSGAFGEIRTRFGGMNQAAIAGGHVDLAPSGSGSVVTYQLTYQDDPGTGPVTNVSTYRAWSYGGGSATDTGLVYASSLWVPPWGTGNDVQIGDGGGIGFTGDLAEFVIYRGALTDADRTLIEQQLASAYGATPEPTRAVFLLLGFAAMLGGITRRRRAAHAA